MKGEINKDFYCSAGYDAPIYSDGARCLFTEAGVYMRPPKTTCDTCQCYHRKWPTPEQFKAEYGFDWQDDAAVYRRSVHQRRSDEKGYWLLDEFGNAKKQSKKEKEFGNYFIQIICACTPWGKPPDNWKPE